MLIKKIPLRYYYAQRYLYIIQDKRTALELLKRRTEERISVPWGANLLLRFPRLLCLRLIQTGSVIKHSDTKSDGYCSEYHQ